jgi:chromosome partitioning protein
MTKVISIINQKGGVGKTTSTVNLGYALASSGKKILVIDLDPQGNASTGLGIDIDKREKTIYEFLVNRNSDPNDFAINTLNENLDIICANVELSGFETEVASESKRAFYLKEVIQQIKQKSQYNQILIDCPPSLSLLTIMSLVASDSVIIPLQTEFFALEGVSQLIKTIERVKQSLNPNLEIQGVLLTMFDKRNKLSNQVDEEARKYFNEKVYKTVIPRNVRLSEAPSHGLPVILYDENSTGSVAYKELSNEILSQKDLDIEAA